METQSINIIPPDGSEVYVFGSSLTSDEASDLDILVLYDPEICSPAKTYEYHNEMFRQIEKCCEVQLDVTLLTFNEELQLAFIQRENAIPLQQYIINKYEQSF